MNRKTLPVVLWLSTVTALIFAMAIIGAITRLTESGLSIMEWSPIKGTLPPLSETEWLRLFTIYQQTDEFKIDNPMMNLSGFKTIFWWEWIHRLWGRLLGVAFALPLAWFWVRGQLPKWLKPWLLLALALGGLQGFLGWFMVSSGFAQGLTDVSHFRLAIHLSMAIALYALLIALTLRLVLPIPASRVSATQRNLLWVFGLLLAILLVTGAFVAGRNAGMVYNEWPTMGMGLLPNDYRAEELSWLASALNHEVALQFNHRWLAAFVASFGLVMGLWLMISANGQAKTVGAFLAAVCILQFLLGVVTLLLGVPVWAGALHQAGALVLVSITVKALFFARVS